MENIFTQKRELSGDGKYWKKEADIAREKVKELEERNKVLEDALKGLSDILEKAASSLEIQANQNGCTNALTPKLNWYAERIKEALSNNQ